MSLTVSLLSLSAVLGMLSGQLELPAKISYENPVREVSFRHYLDRVEARIELQAEAEQGKGCPWNEFFLEELKVDNSDLNVADIRYVNGAAVLVIDVGPEAPLSPQWKEFVFSFQSRCKEKRWTSLLSLSEKVVKYPAIRVSRPLLLHSASSLEDRFEIDEPEWWDGFDPTVPVSFKGYGQVEVKLIKVENGLIVAEGRGTVGPDKKTDVSLTRVQPDVQVMRGTRYRVTADLILSDGQVVHSEARDWPADYKYPYRLSDRTPTVFPAFYERREFKIKVRTEQRGDLVLFFEEGSPFPNRRIERDENIPSKEHTFSIPLTGIEDGAYSFTFQGKNDRGDPLLDAGKEFRLFKATSPHLSGPVSFGMEHGSFLVQYTLSHDVKTELCARRTAIRICVQAEPVPGKTSAEDRLYVSRAKFENKVVDYFKAQVSNANENQASVEFAIMAGETEIFPFRLNGILLNDKHHLIKNLTDAQKIARKDRRQAEEFVRKALYSEGNGAVEEAAVAEIVDLLKKDKKGKLIGAFKLAAKVAASYFAVPLPLG